MARTVTCDGCGAKLDEARWFVSVTTSIEGVQRDRFELNASDGFYAVGANIPGDYCTWKCLLARLAKEAGKYEDDGVAKAAEAQPFQP